MAAAMLGVHRKEHSSTCESPRTLEVHAVWETEAEGEEAVARDVVEEDEEEDEGETASAGHQSHLEHLHMVQWMVFWPSSQKAWHDATPTSSSQRDVHVSAAPLLSPAPEGSAEEAAGAVMVNASNGPPHGLHPLQRHDMHASADGWLPQSGCSQLSNERSPTTREVHAAPRGREDDVWAAPVPFFLPPPAGEGSAKEEEVVGAAQKRQPWQRQ